MPVKPRKRISEAGIDRRLRQHQFAWRIDVDAGKELLQMNVEILRERARNMPFEDEDERAPSDRQSDQDRNEFRRRRAAALANTSSCMHLRHEISEAAPRLDSVRAQLLAHASDQHFKRIGVVLFAVSVDVFVKLLL